MGRLFRGAVVVTSCLMAAHAQAQIPPDIEAGLQTIGHAIV